MIWLESINCQTYGRWSLHLLQKSSSAETDQHKFPSRSSYYWIKYQKKLCLLFALYQSPRQNEFSSFITYLESTLQAITFKSFFLTMLLGDFNGKNKHWFELSNTSYEGSTCWLNTVLQKSFMKDQLDGSIQSYRNHSWTNVHTVTFSSLYWPSLYFSRKCSCWLGSSFIITS